MKVDKVFINTYKYDFHLAKTCIASVRYWYPHIPIYLIKDENSGKFSTAGAEKLWGVKILDLTRRKFGWGYGKLETLFLPESISFLVLDADTVMAGPVLDTVRELEADFIVDEEVQPANRFNEIYYNLNRINELDPAFKYPGYSFNSGQWFGTTGKVSREDFDISLIWSEPPTCRIPEVVFNGDQAHLNFVIHRLEQQKRVSVKRTKIMLWPYGDTADYIDINKIKRRSEEYPLVIHWAGMGNRVSQLNRADIARFFKDFYYSKSGPLHKMLDDIRERYLRMERKVANKFRK